MTGNAFVYITSALYGAAAISYFIEGKPYLAGAFVCWCAANLLLVKATS